MVYGKENLPKDGPYVIATNHMGTWNMVFVIGALYAITGKPIYIIVEDRVYKKNRKLATQMFAFIPREKDCLVKMQDKLKEGEVVGIAVAGVRDKKQKDNKNRIDKEKMLKLAKSGVGYLSNKANVVPVGFWAPDSDRVMQGIWGMIEVLFFTKIKVNIGEPISYKQKPNLERKEARKRAKSILGKILSLAENSRKFPSKPKDGNFFFAKIPIPAKIKL